MKVLIFITLKILEIVGVGIIFSIICLIGFYVNKWNDNMFDIGINWIAQSFTVGILSIGILFIILGLIGGIIIGIPAWLGSNKKLTNKIYKKLKK
jgi:hypothetical protein